MGVMSVLSPSGDDKIEWDANDKEDIAEARGEFDGMKKKGYTFYEMMRDGKQGKELKKFDPKIEAILAIPTTKKG